MKKTCIFCLISGIIMALSMGVSAEEQADVVVYSKASSVITSTTKTEDTGGMNDTAKKVFDMLNAEREKNGLTPLKVDEALTACANTRAAEQLENYGHVRPDGNKWSTVFGDKIKTLLWWGENLARKQKTPERIVKAWMESEGHRKNILSEKYTHGAVAYSVDQDGNIYWLNLFWTPES